MKNKSAGIIGYGVLGKAYAKALGIYKYMDLVESSVDIKEMCATTKWIYICVPTPPTKSGDCDTSIVESWVKEISNQNKKNTIVIKSTVKPGTANKLMKKYGVKIISSPEFLTESTALQDAKDPDLMIIGTKDKKLARAFNSFQKRSMKKYSPYVVYTDNKTAEFIKYSINSFYALKVVFANQLYDSASKEKVAYDDVMDAMYHRKWIGDNHLKIFHKGKRGYTGKCLPKDMSTFAKYTKSPLLKLAQRINKQLVAKGRDKAWKKVLAGHDPKAA